jgi:enamine deaminase RidA (YjgF/YER057c/UK114 family)
MKELKMDEDIAARLAKSGIEIPAAAAPAASYISYVQSGNLIFIAGQLPLSDGTLIATGVLGRALDLADGQAAARQCAINILAQLQAATGDLEKIVRIVKITAFVASSPDFTAQHLVTNGASDLLVAILGEKGKHARSSVGVSGLPLNAPVEIEAIVEVRQ